jgi:hypothetical protein
MNARLFAVLTLTAGLGFVRPGSAEEPKTSLSGHLMVKACADRYRIHAGTEAVRHALDCSAKWDGPVSDLGLLLADGTFYEFDKTGKVLAKEALGKVTDPSTASFTVTGRIVSTMGGFVPSPYGGGIRIPPVDKIKVEEIKQAP